VADDVLIGGTTLSERLQLVHVGHVRPERREPRRYLEFAEGFGADADVLESRHQLAVEAGHRVAGEEAGPSLRHEIVDPLQVGEERLAGLLRVGRFELRYVHFELGVQIFDEGGHFFVLDEQVVTSRYALHDVSFDLFVFQNRHSSVDQDRGRRGFEIRAEVRWGFLHVHCGHLEADGLQFGQEVQFHEVFLAEEARSFSAAIYRRRANDELDFGDVSVIGVSVFGYFIRHVCWRKTGRNYAKGTDWDYLSTLNRTLLTLLIL
jgi:hypothetical protein